ncbi:MAG: pilus assembly protein PilP [Acidobacteriaceae bacterium]|nr:pilus assembly protein PilP [Acidobacteriaceae bacterium]
MRTVGFVCCSCVFAARVAAQSVAVPVMPEPYRYQPEGRRDPFVSLITPSVAPPPARRAEGLAGVSVDEIAVRGVLQIRDRFVAMIEAPDRKTYIVHQGDLVADGVVARVIPQGLILVQHIADPSSWQKQREVRKLLRSFEDAKEQP